MKRVTTQTLRQKKALGEPIVALTAYDYATATAVDAAGVDLILVGDSLATVVLGYPTTLPVTLEEMLHHTKAVVRGTRRAMVVADMPFLADASVEQAILNGGRFLKEAGAHAVKLEGAHAAQLDAISGLITHGIPVVGHIGFTPQHLHQLGGFRIQGKTAEQADVIEAEAIALEAVGCCAVVLELVPEDLAERISRRLTIPTIGIGAGARCDGQIQVFHDLVGLHVDHLPKHARQYARLHETLLDAVSRYAEDVRSARFETAAPSYVAAGAIDSQEGRN